MIAVEPTFRTALSSAVVAAKQLSVGTAVVDTEWPSVSRSDCDSNDAGKLSVGGCYCFSFSLVRFALINEIYY